MAELDQITVATKRYVRATPKLIDGVFQQGPLIAYSKQNLREDFTGGRLIGENFNYNGLIGGFFLQGKEFNISEPQVEQELQFNIKAAEVNVSFNKFDVQVLNKGENAIYRLIDGRMEIAYQTLGAQLEIGMYLNGQRAGYTACFNGMAEALNDGSTASWDGQTYSTYGTITRGGAVGNSINSTPTNVAGPIEYTTLETTYAQASFGPEIYEPNLGVTTYLAYSYIKTRFQTQQRFNDTQDPKIGFNGMKFNSATLVRSRYAPGTYISGTGDPIATGLFQQMSNGALTAYPTVTAETLWWVNARKPFFNFYVSNDAEFGFGFTGFKPGQGNIKLAGQVLAGCQVTWFPRYHAQLYGITG